jgi:hypothetical protein
MKADVYRSFFSALVASGVLWLALFVLGNIQPEMADFDVSTVHAATSSDGNYGITMTQQTSNIFWDSARGAATGDFSLQVALDSGNNNLHAVALRYIGRDEEPWLAYDQLGGTFLVGTISAFASDTATLTFTRTGEITVEASLWYTESNTLKPVLTEGNVLSDSVTAISVQPDLSLDTSPTNKQVFIGQPLLITATVDPAITADNPADGLWDAWHPPELVLEPGDGKDAKTKVISGTSSVGCQYVYGGGGVYSPTMFLQDGGIYGGVPYSKKVQVADVTVVTPSVELALTPSTTSYDGDTGTISATATVSGHQLIAVTSTVKFFARDASGEEVFAPITKVLPAGKTSVTVPVSLTAGTAPASYTLAAELGLMDVTIPSNKIELSVSSGGPASVTLSAPSNQVEIVGDETAQVTVTAQLWADAAATIPWEPPDDLQRVIVNTDFGKFTATNSGFADANGEATGVLEAGVAGTAELTALFGEGARQITSEPIQVEFITNDAARADKGIYDIRKMQGEAVGPVALKPSAVGTATVRLAALDVQDKTIGTVSLPADMYDEDVIVRFTALERSELQANIEQDPIIVQEQDNIVALGTFRLEFFYADGSGKIIDDGSFDSPITLEYQVSDANDPYTARWLNGEEWQPLADADDVVAGNMVTAKLSYLGEYAKLASGGPSGVYLPLISK